MSEMEESITKMVLKDIARVCLMVLIPLTSWWYFGSKLEEEKPTVSKHWINVEDGAEIDFRNVDLDYDNKLVIPRKQGVYKTQYESPYSTEDIITNSEVEIEDLIDYYGYN